jgi:Holliday junction resolvase RusA-like endonuclease
VIRLIPIDPVSAPRQVRKDAWKPSPAVRRYRAYRDELKIKGLQLPENFHHMVFVLAMPSTWSKVKQAQFEGQPHRQKPDRDNLEKAVLDSYFGEDCHIWNGQTTKVWGQVGMLLIADRPLMLNPMPRPMHHLYERVRGWRVNDQPFEPMEIAWQYADL